MREELIILFDYYGEFLTSKQREIFLNYYFDNFSLSEIAENLSISRNAVHLSLKTVETKLNEYENKLQLNSKRKKILKLLEKIEDDNLKNKIIKLI